MLCFLDFFFFFQFLPTEKKVSINMSLRSSKFSYVTLHVNVF